jgi:DNA repair protein RadC
MMKKWIKKQNHMETRTKNILAQTEEFSDMHKDIPHVGLVFKRPPLDDMPKISSAEDAARLFRKVFDTNTIDLKEHFWVMLLTTSNSLLGIAEVGRGSAVQTIVDVKEILLLGLLTNAQAIVIGHNHPSGSLSASESDILITGKLKKACNNHCMNLLDHIILTTEGHLSMEAEGLMT